MDVVKVFSSADEIAVAALDYVLNAAAESIADHGVFNLVLTGGSTPRKLYELLAGQTADWSEWQFFMCDERYVPLDDERSNQNLAQTTLLSKLPLEPGQIHAVPVSAQTVELAAVKYEQQIRDYFKSDQMPSFDIILLGMGSDAHTASLFPGKPALRVKDKLTVASTPGVLPPPVDRVSFTLPLINAANRVLFMAAGADKAEAFQKVKADLQGSADDAKTPAGKVRPKGELQWFVDQAMAAKS